MPAYPADVVEPYLRAPTHSWSMGIPGAIGEFMYDDGEPVCITTAGKTIHAVTPRGAIRVNLHPRMKCIAYRQDGSCSKTPLQGVAFCLPQAEAELTPHYSLTELGEDQAPLRPEDGTGYLFDLGVGSANARFCVRTADPNLLRQLHQHCGRSVFSADNPVFGAIQNASPARVIYSRLGRIEVYGSIPAESSASPRGPHTHLLPRLLGEDSLLPPIPRELIAPLILYPAHPQYDKYGEPRAFDRAAHESFQELLEKFSA